MPEWIVNFLRYGWPRWWLIRIPDWLLGERATEMLNDFLYPSDLSVYIEREETT